MPITVDITATIPTYTVVIKHTNAVPVTKTYTLPGLSRQDVRDAVSEMIREDAELAA